MSYYDSIADGPYDTWRFKRMVVTAEYSYEEWHNYVTGEYQRRNYIGKLPNY